MVCRTLCLNFIDDEYFSMVRLENRNLENYTDTAFISIAKKECYATVRLILKPKKGLSLFPCFGYRQRRITFPQIFCNGI